MKQLFSRLNLLAPITVRGFVLLLFLGFLYLNYVHTSSDIIATVLVATLFLTFTLLLFIALIAGSRIKNIASIRLLPRGGFFIHSGSPVGVSIELPAVKIPPLYTLTVQPVFADQYDSLVQVSFSGFTPSERVAEARVTFPHRGHWNLSSVHWILSDCFGLTLFQWHTGPADQGQAITVFPPRVNAAALPIIASSYREGDALPHPMDHGGDYYDIKRYHPSDGMNKLLWKLFARSGELLARKPEESVSPEGQIVGFCLAKRPDDALAAAFHEYVRRAYEVDMNIIASCLGAQGEELARTEREVFNLLVDSALQIPADYPANNALVELQVFISKTKKLLGVSSLANVLVFLSESFLAKESDADLAAELGKLVTAEGAEPIFCILPDKKKKVWAAPPQYMESLKPVLDFCIRTEKVSAKKESSLPQFLNTCGQQGWRVLEGGVR